VFRPTSPDVLTGDAKRGTTAGAEFAKGSEAPQAALKKATATVGNGIQERKNEVITLRETMTTLTAATGVGENELTAGTGDARAWLPQPNSRRTFVGTPNSVWLASNLCTGNEQTGDGRSRKDMHSRIDLAALLANYREGERGWEPVASRSPHNNPAGVRSSRWPSRPAVVLHSSASRTSRSSTLYRGLRTGGPSSMRRA
jgi:hypothetical protein